MNRFSMLAAAGGIMLATSLAGPAAAAADPVDSAVAGLRNGSIYVGASTPTIDRSALGGSALDGIKVAIVPTGGPDPVSVAKSIGSRLDPDEHGLTVLVFEGRSYGAASTAHCAVGDAINNAVNRNRAHLRSTNDVTSTVSDFADAVRAAPSAENGCDGSGAQETGFGQDAKEQSHTGTYLLLGIVVLIIVALWSRKRSRRRRRDRELSDARAQVTPYYDRLAAEVNNLDPGDNPTARQALADAAERYSSAGGQLATADSEAKFAQARRTALEGLYAARTARTALGLDPGPALPPIAEPGGQLLDAPREVTVQGQNYQGYPSYTPGAPYFFGGGYGVPGGWYGFPFWETMLVGGMLAGGFGGLGGWGGYGAGYDNGYLTGYGAGENAADSGVDAGSGWGDSGGGGGWGDGGWGDSGGGDFGGGDFGGGDGGGSW